MTDDLPKKLESISGTVVSCDSRHYGPKRMPLVCPMAARATIVTLDIREAWDEVGNRVRDESVLHQIAEMGVVIPGFGHQIRTDNLLQIGPVELTQGVQIGPQPRTCYVFSRGGSYRAANQNKEASSYVDDN